MSTEHWTIREGRRMEGREAKDRLYEQFARDAKAVASPKRIELLELLAQGEHPVEALARATGMGVTNTSAHLQVLRQAQLVESAARGDVVILDVRPAEEFVAGHIPGALSIPLDQLEAALARLPKRARIVAYCRGPYCVLAPRR